MKLKANNIASTGAVDMARMPTAVNYGADAPSLDADMGVEDISPTGTDMDDIPPGSFELAPMTLNNPPGMTHEGDMGRLSVLENTASIFRE